MFVWGKADDGFDCNPDGHTFASILSSLTVSRPALCMFMALFARLTRRWMVRLHSSRALGYMERLRSYLSPFNTHEH